jgi:hypothetical protein
MELIILNDGTYSLVEVTKDMLSQLRIIAEVDCFDLCEIIRLTFTEYLDAPHNLHMMKDGSGYLMGCMCNS